MLTFLGAFSLVDTTPGRRNICFGWKITTLILLQKNGISTFYIKQQKFRAFFKANFGM